MRMLLLSLSLAFFSNEVVFAHCIAKVDGIVPAGTFYWRRSGGEWKRSSKFVIANFQIEKQVEFTLPDGKVLAAVTINASGYTPSCYTEVFDKAELLIKESQELE